MCESCLDEECDGQRPEVTPEMLRLAGLGWDWYRLPGNATGGALHVVLDDMNVDDDSLDYCLTAAHWLNGEKVGAHPPDTEALRGEIIAGLRALPRCQRAMVVHVADPYGQGRP